MMRILRRASPSNRTLRFRELPGRFPPGEFRGGPFRNIFGRNPAKRLDYGYERLLQAGLFGSSEPGTYTLRFAENGTAVEQTFTVSSSLPELKKLGLVLNYFRNDRNTSSDLTVPVYGSSVTRDVHGGWNDASGDVSKYLSVWALIFAAERIPDGIEAATGILQ